VLESQQRLLAGLSIPEADRAARVATQARINEAVLTGRGWEALPADVRRPADTPWFRSWLEFNPAVALDRLRKPFLILHGALDSEIPPANADRLDEIARTVRNGPGPQTTKVIVPGVNHLLVAATTGQPDEYIILPSRVVSPQVGDALIEWLKTVFALR
jgi:pimeloyl-ACP methyl ester carboxylesterase